MTKVWHASAAGVLQLPSGALVRGRGLRGAPPVGPAPTFAVYLTTTRPEPPAWPHRWIRWPDFGLPIGIEQALVALDEAHARLATDRVEIACGGGIGRTGTGLAVLCALDGLAPDAAVDWVRRGYHPRAVEVPWQRLVVRRAAHRR